MTWNQWICSVPIDKICSPREVAEWVREQEQRVAAKKPTRKSAPKVQPKLIETSLYSE